MLVRKWRKGKPWGCKLAEYILWETGWNPKWKFLFSVRAELKTLMRLWPTLWSPNIWYELVWHSVFQRHGIWRQGSWEVLELDKIMRVKPWFDIISAVLRKGARKLDRPFHTSTKERPCEETHPKKRPPEWKLPCWQFNLGLPSLHNQEIHLYSFNHPWKPQKTNTKTYCFSGIVLDSSTPNNINP